MKYTFTFEGDTRSYSQEASKTVSISFENPAGQKVILDEFLNFLKATGEYIGPNAQLNITDYDASEVLNKANGIKIDFSNYDTAQKLKDYNLNDYYNEKKLKEAFKDIVGPADC